MAVSADMSRHSSSDRNTRFQPESGTSDGAAPLGNDPRPPGVKALVGEAGLWRIRVGDYRVVYEINDTELIVLVVRIAHRSDVYRRY